jgi:2-C-methyl-D-erythritol 2,4-cyclodiphosphate synthase
MRYAMRYWVPWGVVISVGCFRITMRATRIEIVVNFCAQYTIIAQSPKMAPHIDAMKEILAQDLDCAPATINIKATTTERLGYIGREEGIAAEAVVILETDQ